MSIWTLYNYDIVGNSKDGYTVNNTYEVAGNLEVKDDASYRDIMQYLKSQGYLKKTCQLRYLEFDGDDEIIFINQIKDGMPIFELRKNEEGEQNASKN